MAVTGGIAWIALSISVVFSATIFADLGQPLVQAIGPALLLVAAASCSSRALRSRASRRG